MVVKGKSSTGPTVEWRQGEKTRQWGYTMPMPGVKIYRFLDGESGQLGDAEEEHQIEARRDTSGEKEE